MCSSRGKEGNLLLVQFSYVGRSPTAVKAMSQNFRNNNTPYLFRKLSDFEIMRDMPFHKKLFNVDRSV